MAVSSQPAIELIQRAVEALQRRDFALAEQLSSNVIQRFGPEANALMVLAGVRTESGRLAEATRLYEQARALMPTHIHVLVNLAAAYRASGRLQDARTVLDAALQVDPNFAIAHNNLGNVLQDLGDRATAQRAFERAATLNPRYPEPVSSLAWLAQEQHRLGDAQELAERALALAPKNTLARLTIALVKLRLDDAAASIAIVTEMLREADLSLTNRIIAQGCLGEANDKLARYPEAFAAFSAANALQHEQCSAIYAHADGPLSPAGIGRIRAFVDRLDVSSWRPAPAPASTPVFLVGFPRSGTTLLDQILASHGSVTTLEERDTLIGIAGEMTRSSSALNRWEAPADGEIHSLRERYWQRVMEGLAGKVAAPIFIDKQPLNAVLLPLIYRLFPSCKVILAVRDPRDVVLSCFQQRFGMNEAMFQLLRLDTAARYYDSVMNLVSISREKLPLQVHVIKYEDVIGEFETTMRGVLGFLGLAWDENVRRYADTARARTINTPSATQVVRPLYGSSRGKWRHYAAHLEPYLPTLIPWVRHFDYEIN